MKLTKMIVLFCVAAILLLCGCAAAEEAPGTAVEMTRRMGNGINLGNTMEACNNGKSGGNTTDDPRHYETYWGQPVTTPRMLQGMKEAGFDTIRIPVAWMTNATHLNQGDYTISPKYMDRVEEVLLKDDDTGLITDLLKEDCTFHTEKGDNCTRFRLFVTFRREDSQTPTDNMENHEGDNRDSVRKFIYRNSLFILRDGQLYDVVGNGVCL